MARKTIEEQIKALEEKEQILKARKQQLIAKNKEKERKARTHRLIEVGALIEKALSLELDTPEKRNALLDILLQERPGRNGSSYSYGSYFREQIENMSNGQE